MKRITPRLSTVIMIAVLTIVIAFTSCQKENQPLNSTLSEKQSISSSLSQQESAPLKVDVVHVPLFIEDGNVKPPAGDATLLYDINGHTPVVAPDGHQITLGEFNNVSGYADIKCINGGTHVVIHVKGLIPNGVYTMWVVTFKSPGFDGSNPFSNGRLTNQIGEGALGAPDGSQNVFTASAAGTASLSVTAPAQSLSEFGTIGNCLSSEYQVQLAAAYHLDSHTHGETPGDPSTWVVQFAFPFSGSQL